MQPVHNSHCLEFIPSFTNNKFVTVVTNQSYQHRNQCKFQFSNRGCWFGFNGHGCCYQHYSYEPYPAIPHLPTTDIPTELPALRDVIINMMEKLQHILAQLNAPNNIVIPDDIPQQSPAFIPSQRRSRSKRSKRKRSPRNAVHPMTQKPTEPLDPTLRTSTREIDSITRKSAQVTPPKSKSSRNPATAVPKSTTTRGNPPSTARGNTKPKQKQNHRRNQRRNLNKNKKKKASPNQRPKPQKKKKKTTNSKQKAFAAAFSNMYDENTASSDPQLHPEDDTKHTAQSNDDTKQFDYHNQTIANIQRLSRQAAKQSRPLSIKDTYGVLFDGNMTSSDPQPTTLQSDPEDDAKQSTFYDENPQLIMNAFRKRGKPQPPGCEEAFGDIYIYATHYAQYCSQYNITDQTNASNFIIWALRIINEKFSINCEDTEAITDKYSKISQPLGIDLIWEIIKEINAKFKINKSWIS